MKSILITALLFFATPVSAQHTVNFIVKDLPDYHDNNSAIYIAGSFNNWNPQHENYRFGRNEMGQYVLALSLPAGQHEFKLTRGGWNNAETAKGGASLPNRMINISSDMQVEISVADWADNFETAPAVSTANAQVKLLDTAFYIPQLN